MSTPVSVRPAATRRQVALRAAATGTLFVSLLFSAGCAETTPPLDASAADASARVAPAGYRPVLGTYSGARPVEPAPWTAAPKKEGAQ